MCTGWCLPLIRRHVCADLPIGNQTEHLFRGFQPKLSRAKCSASLSLMTNWSLSQWIHKRLQSGGSLVLPLLFLFSGIIFYHEEPFLIHLGKLVIPLMGACSLFYILPSYLLLLPSLWLPVSLTLLSSPSPHCVHLHRFWTRMHLIFCLSTTISASTRWGIHLPNTDMTPGGVKEPPDRETWTI